MMMNKMTIFGVKNHHGHLKFLPGFLIQGRQGERKAPVSGTTCKKTTAVAYHLRVQEDGYRTWADITIEEWPKGGSFKCISDYGDYAYIWSHIGDQTLREFLCGLDFYYFMNKTRHGNFTRFSLEKTIEELKRGVVEARKQGDLSKDDARLCWDELVSGFFDECGDNSGLFWEKLYSAEIMERLYDNDACSVPVRDEVIPDCKGFWDVIWPAAKKVWQEELAAEKQGGAA